MCEVRDELVRLAAKIAEQMARDNKLSLWPDWEEINDQISLHEYECETCEKERR